MHDIIVIGGGAAGMTAALYGLRNGKSVLVIEKSGFGGQITHSPKVENFPGTLSISGNELADSMMEQMLAQGADIEIETVTGIENLPDKKIVTTEEGSRHEGKSVVIATGVKHRMLGIEGEAELVGEGVSFCAVCDGDFYKDKRVCVVGGGNSALQEAILLADKCSSVTMLQDLEFFTGEERLQSVLFAKPNVKSYTKTHLTSFITESGELRGVKIDCDGEEKTIDCDGVFVAIGLIPENGPFAEIAALNDYGYFDSGEDCKTKTPGIFVAGDCRSKRIRQLTTASADGAIAALAACDYINCL